MRKRAVLWVFFTGLMLCASAVQAVLRFPPPQFETDYTIPSTTTPAPKAAVWDGIDAGVLLVCLLLASWLILKKRSRGWILSLMIFSLLYFGFWRKGCVCPIGAIGNVTWSLFDPNYALPLVVLAFFLLPLITTLFFGRTFCGAVCPLGAIQDLVVLRPLRVPVWLESALRLGGWLYLSLAVLFAATGSGLLICRYDPFVSFFRLSANSTLWILGILFLAVGVFIARPYCRFLCPYGLILRQLSRLSGKRVTITPDECIHCRLCEDACPVGAIDRPTARWPENTRPLDRKRLGLLFAALPLLAVVGGWIGYTVHPVLSRAHPTVRLAEQMRRLEAGHLHPVTDEIRAFQTTGRTSRSLYEQQAEVVSGFAVGGTLVGVFVALVAGGKLIQVSIRRRREDYEANRAGCLACGRCFAFCPQQRIQDKERAESKLRPRKGEDLPHG